MTTTSFDLANQLTGWAPPSTSSTAPVTYTYGPGGLLANRTQGTQTSTFEWDESGGQPVLLADGTNDYVYGPDGEVLEQIPLGATSSSQVNWLHEDDLGSVRAETNATGALVGTVSFDAYGNPTQTGTSGTMTVPFGFTSAWTDPSSGFVYLQARWYDPATGQFLSVDPLVAQTGQPYEYVGDDPINAVDPLGLCWSAHCLADDALHAIHTAASVVSFAAGTCAVIAGLSGVGNLGVSEACGALALGASVVQAASGAALYSIGQESGWNLVLDVGTVGVGALGKAAVAAGDSALAGAEAYRAASSEAVWPLSSALRGMSQMALWSAKGFKAASYAVNVPNAVWGGFSSGEEIGCEIQQMTQPQGDGGQSCAA